MRAQFYMDAGSELELVSTDGQRVVIPRFAAWGDTGRGKPEVIECGDDLVALRTKYGDAPLVELPRRRG